MSDKPSPHLSLPSGHYAKATNAATSPIPSPGSLPARAHLEQSLALQSMRQQPADRLLDDYAWIGGVVYEALVLEILGYPDQARQRSTEALTWARRSRQPFSRSATCIQAGLLSICLREARLTQQLAEEGLGIAREENLAQLVALGTFYQGWVFAAQGQTQDGIAQMQQGLTALRAIKATWYQSYFLALLAEVHGKEGGINEGSSVLREAFALRESTGERFAEAELYRIKGQLALQLETRGWRLETSSPSPQASSLKGSSTGGGGLFPQGYCYCSPAERKVVGTAGGDELRPVMAAAGQEPRCATPPRRHLPLVY